MKRLLPLLLPLLLLFGCSAETKVPDKEAAREVIASYSAALSEGNWEEVCQNLSAESQESLRSQTGADSCLASYESLPAQLQENLEKSASGAKVVDITISDESAEVEVKIGKERVIVPLRAEDGVWRVHLFRPDPGK